MKIKLLLLTIFLTQTLIAQLQTGNLENGGFESWETKELSEDPLIWESANQRVSDPVVTKVSGYNGAGYGAKLETKIINEDTIFGYVLHGQPGENDTEYIPYNDLADSIVGWFRYDIEPNDSALIVVGFKTGSNIESATWIKIGGEQPNWKRFSYKLNPHVGVPDSMYLGFASSDAIDEENMKEGSWIEIDSVYFVDNQGAMSDTIPNGDFEYWNKITIEDPVGWWTFNSELGRFGYLPAKKSNSASLGNYSVLLETLGFNQKFFSKKKDDDDEIPGFTTNGEFHPESSDSLPFTGVPYSSRPTKFTGSYKSYPAYEDTGIIALVFYKDNKILEYKELKIVDTVKEFKDFSFDLFLSEKPDTMLIVAYAGEEIGSKLYVDNLSLSDFILEVAEVEKKAEIVVFPNPSKDGVVNILMEGEVGTSVGLEVYDLEGKMVRNISNLEFYKGNTGQVLSTLNMNQGVYLFKFRLNESSITQRVFVE